MSDFLSAILLGVVEGLTEFVPVSSTGHLILVGSLINFQSDFGKLFEVVIQLGAILAVCVLYARKLWTTAYALPSDPQARRFVAAVAIAFLPSAIFGLALHDFIKNTLFSPLIVAISLFLGGLAILAIELFAPAPKIDRIEAMPRRAALGIGLFQVLSMIPGVSRAGATILGGVSIGVERRTATEFSFFLAIPTMLGAATVDLWKTHVLFNTHALLILGTGFATSFVVAMLVIKWLMAFVGRHGFTLFGWYRVVLGGAMLIGLAVR
jgi:undecaprenyl-diphosphatase